MPPAPFSTVSALGELAGRYDVLLCDLWGCLHNGVAPYPVRLEAVERLVAGRTPDEATQNEAGELAIRGARALRHNDYKIPMMRNLVRRAVRSVAA